MDTPDFTTPLRVCITCGQEFPLTREFFCPVVSGRYLSRDCRACRNAAARTKRDHKKEIARGAVYRAENKDKIAEYNREYRKRNVERRKAYNNQWNAEHRAQTRATEKVYREKHPEVRHGIKARRRAKAEGSTGECSTADLVAIKAGQTDKKGRLICWVCNQPIIGNEPPPHLPNGARLSPHLDHWVPIDKDGTTNPGNLHYTHGLCNLHKADKHPTEIGRLL